MKSSAGSPRTRPAELFGELKSGGDPAGSAI